jgi:hypothetical protein
MVRLELADGSTMESRLTFDHSRLQAADLELLNQERRGGSYFLATFLFTLMEPRPPNDALEAILEALVPILEGDASTLELEEGG